MLLSDELLAEIKLLFEEEQLEALEYQQGNRNITVEKQIKLMYGKKPIRQRFYDKELFLDKWAEIIKDNFHMIDKIRQLKVISATLADQNSFSKSTTAVRGSTLQAKNRGIKNRQTAYEILAQNKSRSGAALRSEDYDGLEQMIDLEDQLATKSSLEIGFKSINHSAPLATAKPDPIGEVKISEENKFLIAPNEKSDPAKELENIKEQMDDMPAFNTLQTDIGRSKSRNTGLESSDNFAERLSNNTGVSSSIDVVKGIAALKANEADINNWRKHFWNKFYILFSPDWRPCP